MDPTSNAHPAWDWLGDALGEPVTVVAVHDVGAGVGLLAAVSLVELADGRRLYVKAPSSDPRARAIAEQFGYYTREAGAYRFLLGGAALPTANCRAVIDRPGGPVLVLDELLDHRPADQLVGATATQALAVASLAADIHARFWNHPVLAAATWLPGPTDPAITIYERYFALTWDAFVVAVEGLIPATHLNAAQAAMSRFGLVCETFSDAPRTLVHGDFRLDNVLFAADGTAAVIDWQLAAWGRGAYDLAFFAAGSIDEAVLAEIEDDLITQYHDRLVANGVEHVSRADCFRDYLGGLIMNLPNPVTALVAVPPGNERGAALLRENARRALATVARHAGSLSSW
jgi:Ecdysteroid kinase-like family